MSHQLPQRRLGDLSSNVSFLGSVLGDILKEQGGDELFQAVEGLRVACKKLRSAPSQSRWQEVHRRVQQLTPHTALQVVRAFTTYFHLINMAEESHRVRRISRREIDEHPSPRRGSITETLGQLKASNLTIEELEPLIANLSFRPVFTAHPTEARRMTLLTHLREASRLVDDLNEANITPRRRQQLTELLCAEITNLWETNELRLRTQTVLDEVRTALYYFDHVVFDVVGDFYDEFAEALDETYPELSEQIPTFLTFGSWIGGDRDGNPNVSADITEATLRMQRGLILSKYIERIRQLTAVLTASTELVPVSEALIESLQEDQKRFGDAAEAINGQYPSELYRQKLTFILHRLEGAESRNRIGLADPKTIQASVYESEAYSRPEELLGDLRILKQSLDANHGERVSRVYLTPLLWQVKVFGFHLCSLDVRDHQSRHLAAIDEILRVSDFCPNYSSLSETQKAACISSAIANRLPLPENKSLSESTRGILEVFEVIARGQSEIGPEALDTYIVSFTQEASDLLVVLYFAASAGLFDPVRGLSTLQVVPLFETERDLESAPTIMRDLYENSVYRHHLKAWRNRQQIMIGYSDSAKDAGYLTSNWALYTAQKELSRQADELGIETTFFHGRGGAIGRGGGPLYQAILGQPAGTIRGKAKVTEQGEVLYTRYGNAGIAHRHLEQVLSSIITVSLEAKPARTNKVDDYEIRFHELSETAGQAYRDLVASDSGFLRFLEEGTPLLSIMRLRIASRPPKRGAGQLKLADLRAIPWVFAWIQSRYGLPGWYGVGSALESSIKEGHLLELRQMYQKWRPFKWLIDSSQISLGKADAAIADRYSELVTDLDVRERYRRLLLDELGRTIRTVNEVVGQQRLLDSSPVLQRSIELRNPYVDPMSYIQIEAISRLRHESDAETVALLRSVVDRSVTGIAAGLQNTG